MKTSYFNLSRYDPGAVSIARRAPWDFRGPSYPPLFPPEDLLRDYHDGLVAWEEYEDRYYCGVLGPLDVRKVFDEVCALVAPHEGILTCWEDPLKPNFHCHRRIAAGRLEDKMGIIIPEIALERAGGEVMGPHTRSLFKT